MSHIVVHGSSSPRPNLDMCMMDMFESVGVPSAQLQRRFVVASRDSGWHGDRTR